MEHTTTTEFETLTREVTLDAINLPRLTVKVDALNKRARRLNFPETTFTITERGERKGQRNPITGTRRTIPTVTVSIVGQTPRLDGGWTFLGAVEHHEPENLLHGDDERLAAYRTAAPTCDHCQKIRSRKKTIIVTAEDGRVAQVGAMCMKDFLGYHGNPETYINYAADYSNLDEDGFSDYTSYVGHTTPIDVLTATAAIIRTHGWTPRSADRGVPTADLTSIRVGLTSMPSRRADGTKSDEQMMLEEVTLTDADVARAAVVLAWVKAIDSTLPSNYLQNLRVIGQMDTITVKHLGTIASAESALAREEQRSITRQVEAGEAAASQFVGTVGQRLTTDVTVKFVRAVGTDYGTSYLVSMTDADGNTLKTFSSGQFGYDAEVGQTLTIKGTVKNHEVYNDTKQTLLTRVALV